MPLSVSVCVATTKCHGCYLQTPDILSVDTGHLFLHAASDGVKAVSLPETCDIIELPGGKCVFKNTKEFQVKMKKYENKFYKLNRKK